MPIYELDGKSPQLPEEYWIAPSAEVIGDVTIARDVSIWFQAVLRGDNEPMKIGVGSNIQEHAMLHSDPGFPLTIGRDVTVGHRAIVHGCEIEDGCLIGMGAIILNGAKIGKNSLIGAGALVGEGKVIPEGSLVLGVPGKVVLSVGSTHAAEAPDETRRSA